MDYNLIGIIALIFLSGCFSASEIALTSLNRAKILSIKNDGKFASNAIYELKQKSQRLLIAILVGNQVVNILATTLATVWGIHLVGEGNISYIIFIFTIALVAFGSIAPKAFALGYAEIFARIMAYPLLVFVSITQPIIWRFEKFIDGISWIFSIKKSELTKISEQEIEAMIEISTKEGVLEEEEELFLKHVLRMGSTRIEQAMTVLKDIYAIDRNIKREELAAIIEEHYYEDFPVYENDLNNIKGTIRYQDISTLLYKTKSRKPLLNTRISQPLVVPKTATFMELFRLLVDQNKRMAIVIDEYGQTIGLITLDDIMQEVTGARIKKNKQVHEPTITKNKRGYWEADGTVTIAKLKEEIKIDINLEDHKTLSLLILEELKRFPEENEVVSLNGLDIKIKRIEKNVVKKVQIKKNHRKNKKAQ